MINDIYVPIEIHDIILSHFEKMHGVEALIELRTVSSVFRDGVDNILMMMEVLDPFFMEFISDDRFKLFPNLKILDLSFNNKITNDGIKQLKFLHTLNLDSNSSITNDGIKDIPLLILNLNRNGIITDEGIRGKGLIELYVY